MKKLFCCPALELFCCLPLWKTVLFVSSRAFSLSTPTFLLSTPVENSEATWKKATKYNKLYCSATALPTSHFLRYETIFQFINIFRRHKLLSVQIFLQKLKLNLPPSWTQDFGTRLVIKSKVIKFPYRIDPTTANALFPGHVTKGT